MAASVELEIRNLLLSNYEPAEVFGRLLPKLFSPQTSLADRRSIFAFAYNGGLFKDLMLNSAELAKQRHSLPFSLLIETLNSVKVEPTKDLLDAIIKGAKRLELLDEMALARQWDHFSPEILEIKKNYLSTLNLRQQKLRDSLFAKLEFLKNERMVNEERDLLKLLGKMFPQDRNLPEAIRDFEDRWSRHIIAQHGQSELSKFEATETAFSQEELVHLKVIAKAMIEVAQQKPSAAYDFAIALLFMDYIPGALDVLFLAPQTVEVHWLRAELLLRGRRYIECLDLLAQLEQLLASDPDTIFAVTYLRAQALWGLGQGGNAMELLKNLIAVRPQYRSAISLLKHWESGGLS